MAAEIQMLQYNHETDRKKWEGIYKEFPLKGAFHEPGYVALLAREYGYSAVLFYLECEQGKVYFPCLLRSLGDLPFVNDNPLTEMTDLISSWYYGGPLLDPLEDVKESKLAETFARSLNTIAQNMGIVSMFVRFDPNFSNHNTFTNLWNMGIGHPTVYVDLLQSEEEIFASFQGRCRTRVRKSQKLGVQVELTDSESDWEEFISIYMKEMERKNSDMRFRFDAGFFKNIKKMFGSDLCFLVAREREEILGGVICVYGEGAAYDYLRATKRSSWNLHVNNLLVYRSIIFAKTKGCFIYDLMGGEEGMLHFKQGFSKTGRSFFTASHVFIPEAYTELSEAWNECSKDCGIEPVEGYFPAYRQGFE